MQIELCASCVCAHMGRDELQVRLRWYLVRSRCVYCLYRAAESDVFQLACIIMSSVGAHERLRHGETEWTPSARTEAPGTGDGHMNAD